jgi:nitrate reductase NapAB chaperone NapD
MVYHVMVYTSDINDPYGHPYAVHFFTQNKPTYDWAFAKAAEVLDSTFPEWRSVKRYSDTPALNFCGIESIPLPIPESVIVAKFEWDYDDWGRRFFVKHMVEVKPLSERSKQMILEYRLCSLTVDIDHKWRSALHAALERIREMSFASDVRVFETERGFHIRAKLSKSLSFDELLQLREELDDDYMRRRIDRAYHEAGYTFLTNLLFNEKAWWKDGSLQSYTEVSIDPSTLVEKYDQVLDYTPPKFEAKICGGEVWTEGNKVYAIGAFSKKVFNKIVENLEATVFREAKEKFELKEKLREAYYDIHPYLALVIDKCEVYRNGNGKVVIKVPSEYSQFVGRLIGKEGCNVRSVSQKLGLAIRIVQEGVVSEDIDLKQRLKRLMKEVV